MKKHTKALGLLMAAVMLVSAATFGTVAYLTSTTEEVKNTFTVGKVKITLDETKVDEYGKPVSSNERVKSNSYKLIPGYTYTKDPTVHVEAGSEACYVRMKVTVNCQGALDEMFEGHDEAGDLSKVFLGFDSKWKIVDKNPEIGEDARTYEFRYAEKVPATSTKKDLEPLFSQIKAPEWLTADNLANLTDLQIKVTADAIQADGFGDAEAAWEAFDK